MVQEEQFQSNSNSGPAGSRSSKKLKQKKIPQRGLGVAQLEKIRLEEQQKKDAAAVAVVPSSPCIVVPLPPGPPLNPYQSQSSIPFQSSPADLSSSSSLFRQTPPIPISSLDLFVPPPPLPTTTPLYGLPGNHPGGAGRGVAATMDDSAATVADGYFPTMWNSHEFTEGSKLDPGFTFRSHLQNETNNIWPRPIIMQRKQPQQQHSSSMVNVASVTSSSSELNLQMEPPSNQSYYNNYTLPLLPEEEKVCGDYLL
uniref:Uncharacterized protein n=1 Tax=Nelumbo nucifera TaxID=4432 RepID=A0A822XPX4_NELNU|nr:TPA_asm: hypothetical protein HUJ06_022602 [Nelumbo nucifera]